MPVNWIDLCVPRWTIGWLVDRLCIDGGGNSVACSGGDQEDARHAFVGLRQPALRPGFLRKSGDPWLGCRLVLEAEPWTWCRFFPRRRSWCRLWCPRSGRWSRRRRTSPRRRGGSRCSRTSCPTSRR
uniref:Uncharacterized protein n=1 Tax=Arundo donax TaxID=35708 RepID=A0A0A8XX77_ARUDO